MCLEVRVFVVTDEIIPLAVGILGRQSMENRHFIHQAAEFSVGTRIAACFQKQYFESGASKTGGEWTTARARSDHDIVKLCGTHVCLSEGFQKLDQIALLLLG